MGLGFGIPKSVNEGFVIFTEFSGSRVLKLGFHVFVQAMLIQISLSKIDFTHLCFGE